MLFLDSENPEITRPYLFNENCKEWSHDFQPWQWYTDITTADIDPIQYKAAVLKTKQS